MNTGIHNLEHFRLPQTRFEDAFWRLCLPIGHARKGAEVQFAEFPDSAGDEKLSTRNNRIVVNSSPFIRQWEHADECRNTDSPIF